MTDAIGVPRKFGGKDLDSDFPIQLRVYRAINFAHAAGADFLKERSHLSLPAAEPFSIV